MKTLMIAIAALTLAADVAPGQAKPAAKAPQAETKQAPTKTAPTKTAPTKTPPAPAATKAAGQKAAGKAAAAPTPAAPAAPAQDTAGPPPTIYREAFAYAREGRRDPFNSLLTTNELRPTLSDLKITGIAYDPSGRNSQATLRDLITNARYTIKNGSTLGRMRVAGIRPRIVVFTIDEFGTTRQDSLVFGDTTKARIK